MSFLPTQTGEGFVARLKENGWNPEEALMAYQEWRTFGFAEVRREPEPGSSEALWWSMRQRLASRLEALNEPEDWTRYRAQWNTIAWGYEPRFEEVRRDAGALYQAGPLSRDETIQRISGAIAREDLAAWHAIREVGVDWDDVAEVVARDKVPLSPTETFSAGGPLSQIHKAMEISGLRSFQWPAANGGDEATVSCLASQLMRANTELNAQTGWEGPVLGLNGRVSIGLGMSRDGGSGYCSGGANPHVVTRADYSWGPVAHEWLHGLDSVMSQDLKGNMQGMASRGVGRFASEWTDLMEGLNRPILGDEDRQDLARQTVDGLLRRHEKSPDLVAWLTEAIDAMEQPRWDREHALAVITPWAREANDDDLHAAIRAELVLTELDLVAAARKRATVDTSPWIQFADRFDENLSTHHANRKGASDLVGYLKEGIEQAAHSFESLFPAGSLTSDVAGATRSMRYPLPRETEIQRAHWKRLFDSTASWWRDDTAQPASSFVQPLAAVAALRLQNRRRRQAETESALPLAARPRAAAP